MNGNCGNLNFFGGHEKNSRWIRVDFEQKTAQTWFKLKMTNSSLSLN